MCTAKDRNLFPTFVDYPWYISDMGLREDSDEEAFWAFPLFKDLFHMNTWVFLYVNDYVNFMVYTSKQWLINETPIK